jgi:CBS domain-containing protein
MKLREILQAKGCEVHTIGAQATLHDVVQKLVDKNCGSLVVIDEGRMVGIITERDILRATAAGLGMPETRVADRMSVNLITGRRDDDVESSMGLMTRHRIRHLPITDQDELVGMISIGDVVKAQHDSLSVENHYLKSYIQS